MCKVPLNLKSTFLCMGFFFCSFALLLAGPLVIFIHSVKIKYKHVALYLKGTFVLGYRTKN